MCRMFHIHDISKRQSMPTEVFVGDRPELGVGTGSNALAGPAVGRLGGAHKLTRRFDICKASADKSSRAATLAATDCSACANQSPASCLTRGCVTGITRCCMHGDVARWLYWSRPGDRRPPGRRWSTGPWRGRVGRIFLPDLSRHLLLRCWRVWAEPFPTGRPQRSTASPGRTSCALRSGDEHGGQRGCKHDLADLPSRRDVDAVGFDRLVVSERHGGRGGR